MRPTYRRLASVRRKFIYNMLFRLLNPARPVMGTP